MKAMGSLLPYEDAIRILRDSARACPAGVEEIPLAGSAHRVIAREVRAGFDVPSLDNSAMDGYAVRSCDLQSGWNEFPVSALKIAGDLPDAQVREKTAVQIMTGAPLPQGGFDLIVKVEDVYILKDSTGGTLIRFESISASAAHVRRRGSDFEKGDLLVRPGSRIDAKVILGLAALGCARVVVHRKPRVALISTGNELVPHDQTEVPEGAIRNSTAPYLMQALRELGCEVRNFGVVRDEASEKPEEFERALKAALSEGFDLILTTGAVSMGIHDFIRPSVERNGGRVLFHKVAIRPGKPVLFSEFPDFPETRLIGLPGNPVSTVVGLDFFVAPFLRERFGIPEPRPLLGRISGTCPSAPSGLKTFFRAKAESRADGVLQIEIPKGQASFMVHSFSGTNGWAVIPASGVPGEAEGIEFYPFAERMDA